MTRWENGMRMIRNAILIGMTLALLAPVALAEEAPAEAPAAAEAAPAQGGWQNALKVLGACFGAALAAGVGGLAIAKVGARCQDAMARQPEAAGQMFGPMLIAAAMIEGATLFAILVSLLVVVM